MSRARSLARLANENVFTVDTSNNVGVNSTTPVEKLNVVGVVSATSFFGDGTGLTGVASTDYIITGTAATFTGGIDAAQSDVSVRNLTGVAATFTGDVSVRNLTGVAATFTGVLTYEDVTNVDSVGIITARSDISIADKIIHTGDTDTVIRFPAADTFTVETGGSEAIRVDSSQQLLLGTTSSFEVGSSAASDVQLTGSLAFQSLSRFSANGAGPNLIFGKSRNASPGSYTVVQDDDDLGNITFAGDDGTDLQSVAARIVCEVDGSPGSNDMPGRLIFSTTADGASSPTERVRITSGGTAIFKAGTAEKFQSGTTLSAASGAVALSSGNVALFTSNESGNQTVNFTGVHATLSSGENVSFTVIITPNSSGVINAVQIDSVAQTIQWSGGSAPSAGASGKDIYTFTLFKTGSGTTDYQVFGGATNYA